jgi:hypothetical protein
MHVSELKNVWWLPCTRLTELTNSGSVFSRSCSAPCTSACSRLDQPARAVGCNLRTWLSVLRKSQGGVMPLWHALSNVHISCIHHSKLLTCCGVLFSMSYKQAVLLLWEKRKPAIPDTDRTSHLIVNSIYAITNIVWTRLCLECPILSFALQIPIPKHNYTPLVSFHFQVPTPNVAIQVPTIQLPPSAQFNTPAVWIPVIQPHSRHC